MPENAANTLKRGDANYYRQLARASWAKRRANYDWAEHARKGWVKRRARRPGTSGWKGKPSQLDGAVEIPH